MTPERGGDGWAEWRLYVVKSLEDLDRDMRQLTTDVNGLRQEFWVVKGKAAAWGAATALLVSVIGLVINFMRG